MLKDCLGLRGLGCEGCRSVCRVCMASMALCIKDSGAWNCREFGSRFSFRLLSFMGGFRV